MDEQSENLEVPIPKKKLHWQVWFFSFLVIAILVGAGSLFYLSFNKGQSKKAVSEPVQQQIASGPTVKSNTAKLMANSKIVFPNVLSEKAVAFSSLPQAMQVLNGGNGLNATSTELSYDGGKIGYKLEYQTSATMQASEETVAKYVYDQKGTVMYGARATYFFIFEFTLNGQSFRFTQTLIQNKIGLIIIQSIE